MSSVTVPLYHYALLKGYLSGQTAPSEVLVAVEALYMAAIQGPLRSDALEAIQAVKEAAERLTGLATASPDVEISIAKPELRIDDATKTAAIELPPLTKRALEMAAGRADTPADSIQPQTDEEKITAFIEARAVENCPPAHASGTDQEMVVGMVESKKRKEWSPEARAAAAERMRARQAAGLMGRQKKDPLPDLPEPSKTAGTTFEPRKASTPNPQPAPKAKSVPAIDPTRLITVHTGYAGKREDGQLRDEDWPDIKSRLAKGETKAAIAGDYEVEIDDLDYFIASCQRRESKQPPGGSPRAALRPTGRRELTDDEKKIDAFIRKKGVTKCPGAGTKELAELNRKREEAYRAMTLQEKRIAIGLAKRKRSPSLTPEQKKERQRESMKKWYAANKEKRAAYHRERREQKKQAKQQEISLPVG